MAVLEYEITGSNVGLANAVNDSIALLQKLDNVKLNAFGGSAQSVSNALSNINSGLQQVKSNSDNANLSLKDQGGIAALDSLGRKLFVIKGNSELFGDSIKNQQAELTAYQGTLNNLLSLGFEPLDGDVTKLKTNIDSLTASIAAQNAVAVRAPSRDFVENSPLTPGLANITSEPETASVDVVKELNAQLAAGTITVAEYNAQILAANTSTTEFAGATQKTIAPIEQELGAIEGLKLALKDLNAQKLQADEGNLPVLNKEIQATEVEIQRLSNIGKTGFDTLGNALPTAGVDKFGKALSNATSLNAIAGRAVSSFSRQIITLGVGFLSLEIGAKAIESLIEYISNLDAFTGKLNVAKQTLLAFNEIQENAAKGSATQLASLQILTATVEDVTKSMTDRIAAAEELKKEFPDELKNSTALQLVNGDLAKSYDVVSASIIKQAAAAAALTKITELEGERQAIVAKQNEIQNQANIDKSKAVTVQQGATGSSLTGVVQGQTISAADQQKGIQTLADYRKNKLQPDIDAIDQTIKAVIGAANGNSALAKTIIGGNNLIKASLSEFDQIIANAGNKNDLEADKAALQAKLDALAPNDPQIAAVREKLQKVDDLLKQYQVKPTKTSNVNTFGDLNSQIDALLAKTNALGQGSGLTGYAEDVQKITAKYIDLNSQIDKFNQKTAHDLKTGKITPQQAQTLNNKSSQASANLIPDESSDLQNAAIAEAQKTADAITKINNDFGVKGEQGRQAELDSVQKLYDNELAAATKGILSIEDIQARFEQAVSNANGNKAQIDAAIKTRDAEIQAATDSATKIVAINNGKVVATQNVNDKYVEIVKDAYARINEIAQGAQDVLLDAESDRIGKLALQYDKLKTEADKYFDTLRKAAVNGEPGLTVPAINSQQNQVNSLLDSAKSKAISEELSKDFSSEMQRSIDSFADNFYTAITTLGATRQSIDDKYASQLANATDQATKDQINQQKALELSATTSFDAIFSSLVSQFSDSFNKSIVDSFTKKLTENLGSTLIAPSTKDLSTNTAINNLGQIVTTSGTSFAQSVINAGIQFSNTLQLSATGVATGDTIGNSLSVATSEFSSSVTAAGETVGTSLSTGANAISTGGAVAGTGLSKGGAGLIAAASVLGGVVAGLGKPTNSVTSALGGALSGAAEGALVGSAFGPGPGTVIGAVAGGLLGLVGGLFSASKARKAEAAAQLAESQQQTALLKQSIAYTSSIIGRVTSAGVVTGVSVGAFGQLTATVSGKDLQFVLDRNSKSR